MWDIITFKKTLLSLGLPSKLSNLIIELQRKNTTQIETGKCVTKPIPIKRGVMQGSPLSPSLYNISTDHILQELSSEKNMDEHGFSLRLGLPNITSLGFADDTLIVAKNENSARVLVELAMKRFNEIGLDINVTKSKCISIKKKGGSHLQPSHTKFWPNSIHYSRRSPKISWCYVPRYYCI